MGKVGVLHPAIFVAGMGVWDLAIAVGVVAIEAVGRARLNNQGVIAAISTNPTNPPPATIQRRFAPSIGPVRIVRLFLGRGDCAISTYFAIDIRIGFVRQGGLRTAPTHL